MKTRKQLKSKVCNSFFFEQSILYKRDHFKSYTNQQQYIQISLMNN